MSVDVKQRSYAALQRALATTIGDSAIDAQGYVGTLDDNLVAGLSPEIRRRIEREIGDGDGGELRGPRPKLFAAHSSAALAVNAFGRWIGHERELSVVGYRGFESMQFERKCAIGVAGKTPNLDVLLVSEGRVVAIESKCTEYLSDRRATFSDVYENVVASVAHPTWAAMFRALKEQPRRFRHLDAAQLLKHYLGLKKSFSATHITLLYLFWEPIDWEAYDAFCRHRLEIEEFAAHVADPQLSFVAQSYSELWATWTVQREPAWLRDHVAELRRRYHVAITGDEATIFSRYVIGYGSHPQEQWIGEAGAQLAGEVIHQPDAS